LAAILNDQELLNNPEGLTTKDILKKCENFVRMNNQSTTEISQGTNYASRPQLYTPSQRFPQHHSAQSDADLEDYTIISHPGEVGQSSSEDYEARTSSRGSLYSSNSLVNESSIPVEQRAS
jgi:hypothetical protein